MIRSHAPVSQGGFPEPVMFMSQPSLADEINRQIYQSEVDGGDLPVDAVLEVETKNRSYRLKSRGDGRVLISGHPRHCPEPVLVRIHGSTWSQSMLKAPLIGRGMHLEYWHPTHGVIRTS